MNHIIGSQARCIRCRQPAHEAACTHPLDRPGALRPPPKRLLPWEIAGDLEHEPDSCPAAYYGRPCNACERAMQRQGWH